ncbi:MAG: nucleoside-diphosphate kinase [Patescibacteria group bacterium]
MLERTLVLIKPDAVFSGWTDDIIKRYVDAGLTLVRHGMILFTHEQARAFYAEHEGKPFMNGLVLGMGSGPSVALVLEGEDAIARVRKMNGATDPYKADVGTIRRDFLSAGGVFNTVHGSANEKDAGTELWFIANWL